MATKLFVGSLPYETTSDELRDVFAKVGKVVDANVVMDKMTGRSRGFGFVEMSTDAEAKKAVETLNGTEIGGRKIFVSEARPPRQDDFGTGAGKVQSPGSEEDSGAAAAPAADEGGADVSVSEEEPPAEKQKKT